MYVKKLPSLNICIYQSICVENLAFVNSFSKLTTVIDRKQTLMIKSLAFTYATLKQRIYIQAQRKTKGNARINESRKPNMKNHNHPLPYDRAFKQKKRKKQSR